MGPLAVQEAVAVGGVVVEVQVAEVGAGAVEVEVVVEVVDLQVADNLVEYY